MTIEAMIELIESAANFMRGMTMDPRIPTDTRQALIARASKLDAAAGAAITQAEQTRWYSLDSAGMATLCRDQADAIKTAADNSIMWPNLAPHRAVRLGAIDLARGAGEV